MFLISKRARNTLSGLILACLTVGGSATPTTTTSPTTAPVRAPATTTEAGATPEDALRAYLAAMDARDRDKMREMVFLPPDEERRKWVLSVIDKALFPPPGAKILSTTVKMDGPVAVCEGKIQMPDGESEEGAPMFFVQRDGQWYFVVDIFEGGGLTQAEMDVIEKYYQD